MNKLKPAILGIVLAATCSARAQLEVGFTSVTTAGGGSYAVVTLQSTGAVSFSPESVEAGVYNLDVGGVATPSFCIDVDRDAPTTANNSYSYTTLTSAPPTPSGPMKADQAQVIEQLWAAFGGTSGVNQNGSDGLAHGATVDLAALQVAIWEEMGDGELGYNVSASNNSTVTGDATAYLTYVKDNTAKLPEASLIALTSDISQNYVVPVPEPATILAGILLLVPLGASTLRIVRKSRVA